MLNVCSLFSCSSNSTKDSRIYFFVITNNSPQRSSETLTTNSLFKTYISNLTAENLVLNLTWKEIVTNIIRIHLSFHRLKLNNGTQMLTTPLARALHCSITRPLVFFHFPSLTPFCSARRAAHQSVCVLLAATNILPPPSRLFPSIPWLGESHSTCTEQDIYSENIKSSSLRELFSNTLEVFVSVKITEVTFSIISLVKLFLKYL